MNCQNISTFPFFCQYIFIVLHFPFSRRVSPPKPTVRALSPLVLFSRPSSRPFSPPLSFRTLSRLPPCISPAPKAPAPSLLPFSSRTRCRASLFRPQKKLPPYREKAFLSTSRSAARQFNPKQRSQGRRALSNPRFSACLRTAFRNP